MSDKTTEAMTLALEALNSIDVGYRSSSGDALEVSFDEAKCEAAIAALREALAQEKAEPVAWMQVLADGYKCVTGNPIQDWTPLYTAPPQRKAAHGIEEPAHA